MKVSQTNRRSRSTRMGIAVAGALGALVIGPVAHGATDYTWEIPGDGNWSTATNWNPDGIPSTDDTATFSDASTGNDDATTVYLDGLNATSGRTINKMTFNNSAATTLLGGVVGTPGASAELL